MGGSATVAVAREGRVARLANVTCTLGRHDKPYPEVHAGEAWVVALVRRGTFGYRAASTNRAHSLRPGWMLLGHPDAEFECSHDDDAGDECAALTIGREVLLDVASAASRPDPTPPLRRDPPLTARGAPPISRSRPLTARGVPSLREQRRSSSNRG